MKLAKYITVAIVVLIIGVVCSRQASAHVVVNSTDKSSSAILHIIPDDDPIAGEVANLMFDTQDGFLKDTSEVVLVIKDLTKQTESIVPIRRDGSLISADYIFPTQGAYIVTYTVTSNDKVYVFQQDTRISRGVKGEDRAMQNYTWAEGLLFVVATLFIALLIIGWNKRQDIFAYSKL